MNKSRSFVPGFSDDGFYVYVKPNLCDIDTVIKYISRYLGRLVIAVTHIDSYVGKTLPVLDFISLLIQHIPKKHFKMTHYYELYARHRKSIEKLRRAVPESKRRFLLDSIPCLPHTGTIKRQEADDLDDDKFKEGFYIQDSSERRNFL